MFRGSGAVPDLFPRVSARVVKTGQTSLDLKIFITHVHVSAYDFFSQQTRISTNQIDMTKKKSLVFFFERLYLLLYFTIIYRRVGNCNDTLCLIIEVIHVVYYHIEKLS